MIKTPIQRANYIENEFKKYIRSTFSMRDKEFDNLITTELEKADIFKGPYLSKQNPFEPNMNMIELIKEGDIHNDFKLLFKNNPELLTRPLYDHQVASIKKINSGSNLVISTGTGSGKTESFLYPIINHILNDPELEKPGIRALFLYPMNALVNDQMERLRELLKNYPQIKYGIYTGDTDHKSKLEGMYKNELISREEIRNKPPHILFTNYSMLEYMLIRPQESHIFFSESSLTRWKFVVLDEAHSYRGASAIEMSLLLRRLTGFATNQIQFILTSATLGDKNNPKNLEEITDFASNLTGGIFNHDDIIFARYMDILLTNTTNYSNEQYIDAYSVLKSDVEKSNLYLDMFKDSTHVNKVYTLLKEPKLYDEIRKNLNLSDEGLNALIESILIINSKTRALFDVKYHSFVRSLEGAFITFKPEKNIRLTRHNKINDLIAFETGNCKFCNTIYIFGRVVGNSFIQSKDVDIYENYDEDQISKKIDYFVVKATIDNSQNLDEINYDENPIYILCNKCSHIHDKTDINPLLCSCGSQYQLEIIKVADTKINVNNVTKCIVCSNRSSKAGIIQSFNIGKDQSTALLGQMLYKSMPNNIEMGYKKFIAFSDGRQQASHFASFFKYNHERFLRKKLLIKVLELNPGVPLNKNELLNHLQAIIKQNGLTEDDTETKSLAWLTLLYDLLYVDGKNSGEGLGLYSFELNFDLPSDLIDKINENLQSRYSINYVEFVTLTKIILDRFRYYPSVNYVSGLNQDDQDALEFRSKSSDVFLSNASVMNKNNGKNFLSKNGINNNEKFLKKIFGEKYLDLLTDIWKFSVQHIFTQSHTGGHQIPIDKYYFKTIDNFYVCDSCGKTSVNSFRNICSSPDCSGSLVLKDPNIHFANNYYREEYLNKDIEKVIAKEHTGQINRKKAKSYQEDFNKNKINLLSSSTTFEMGLDIDRLSTVFLRNVPPLPSNYVQRAGRAGRQSGVSAFVLTFCNANSHDYTFFKNPIQMISGKIRPPYFTISNEKIIIRHLISASLGIFFSSQDNIAYFKTVNDFISSLEPFKNYLKSRPSKLIHYIDTKILPNELLDLYGDLKWLHIPESGGIAKINAYIENINENIDELKTIIQQLKDNDDYQNLSYYQFQLRGITEDKDLIKTMSNGGLIPKHGFPVDVVSLDVKRIDSKSNDSDIDLSRDLQIAISEYAPESEVIVDNRIYKSRYVNIPRSKGLTKLYYHECSTCKHVMLKRTAIISCDNCHSNITQSNPPFVIPEYGFTTDGSNKSAENSRKPKKSYSGSVMYLDKGEKILGPEEFTIDTKKATISSFNDDELLILNENEFYICSTCGFSVISDGNSQINFHKDHKTKSGYPCSSYLERTNIGYILKTDVTKLTLSFPGYTQKQIREKATSLLYALLEGISKIFEVERNDISGLIGKTDNNSNVDIIIYDTVPGGAGHSKRLYDQKNLIAAFKTAYSSIQFNCCEVETSCYNCLRNYYNRKIHDKLKRKDAIELIEQILHH